jgi:glutamate racemase
MIGIFDSGIGGMSVLKEIHKLLPGQSYSYYADNAYCPYGEKSPEFIIQRAKEITQTLLNDGSEIIVIACNTATAAAVATLRKDFPDIRFIGMEPAVKPAAEKTSTGIIGILATAGTLKGEKYHNIKDRYAHDVQVVEHVGEGFVELVEANISSTAIPQAETEEIVRRSISPLISAGADHIVLGCTHYPFLESTIKKVASELSPERDITIVNPAPAVAKHLVEVMQKEGIKPLDSRAHILRSSDPERLNPTHNLFIAIVG